MPLHLGQGQGLHDSGMMKLKQSKSFHSIAKLTGLGQYCYVTSDALLMCGQVISVTPRFLGFPQLDSAPVFTGPDL